MPSRPTQALVRRIPRSYVDYYARQGTTVDASRADEQHEAYVRALQAAGLSVGYVDSDESLPDCVFIEDTAVLWQQDALITRMCDDREGEQAAVEVALRSSHSIQRLATGATLDGGDVLHVGEVTYVGLSTRTNKAGAESLRAFLSRFGRRVVEVEVAHCLHLKTGITYLGNGTLLAVPSWFDIGLFEAEDVIFTDTSERNSANCIRIGNHLLLSRGYPGTHSKLQVFAERHNLQLRSLEMSEFEKGEGSLTCLSLIW